MTYLNVQKQDRFKQRTNIISEDNMVDFFYAIEEEYLAVHGNIGKV